MGRRDSDGKDNTCTCKHSSGAILGQASGYKTNGY